MTVKVIKFLYFILITSFFIMSFANIASSADDPSQKAKELSNLKKNVEKIKAQKQGVIKKERNILSELKDIDKQLNTKEKELDIYQKNLEKIEQELRILENSLDIARTRLGQTQMMLNSRLRAMYKLGYDNQRVSYLRLLIDSDNISDITCRYAYISSIAESDKKLLETAIKQKSEIDRQKKLVEEKKQQIANNKQSTERIKNDIINKKKEKNEILNDVRKDKAELTKAQKEMEASINRLERLIAELKRNQEQTSKPSKSGYNTIPYSGTTGLASQAGNIMWPTSGTIMENQTPSMKGVTIKAQHGSDIKSVDNGIVDYARWFDGVGYGNMIIINHGNGYRTLYAHASKISVREGQEIKKGQKIGEVGDTGSLKGASLYFEIWRGTEALPTRRWLESR
ncbi:TPA: hypothetical protein ENS27_01510 [bacterium]|nr:hypothetical protein [bacterium]